MVKAATAHTCTHRMRDRYKWMSEREEKIGEHRSFYMWNKNGFNNNHKIVYNALIFEFAIWVLSMICERYFVIENNWFLCKICIFFCSQHLLKRFCFGISHYLFRLQQSHTHSHVYTPNYPMVGLLMVMDSPFLFLFIWWNITIHIHVHAHNECVHCTNNINIKTWNVIKNPTKKNRKWFEFIFWNDWNNASLWVYTAWVIGPSTKKGKIVCIYMYYGNCIVK